MQISRIGRSVVAALGMTVLLASALAAQITDVVRGRVTDLQGAPIEGARVRVTSYQGQVAKTATTDKGGRFTIIYINGEGDYWIDVTRLGLAPKRYEVRKVGDEEVIIADTRMSSTIATLDAVNTIGDRAHLLPNRSANAPDVGGGDRALTNAVIPPDQAGNLAAMAAGIAGYQLIPGLDGAPDMYSVLGLGGDQNNITFNGLGSGISTLPPDVLATTSINAYPFDVSKGGFSGAQITVQTIPGSNFSRRAITNASIAPPLEFGDDIATQQGQKYTSARFGGNAAGPVRFNEIFYSGAYNVSRRFNDARSLLNTDALGLAAAGVAMDSVTHLVKFLGGQGIPSSAATQLQTQDLFQLVGNLDVMPSASGTGHSFTLASGVNVRRVQPVSRGGLLFATPTHSGESSAWVANGALTHLNYFWFGVLAKTTLGLATERAALSPVAEMPEGIVRVSSTLSDGGSSVRTLSFGGSGLRSNSTAHAAQLSNQLSWFSLDNTHTMKVTSSLAYDAVASTVDPQVAGSFAFNSLADLEAGRASSYSRMRSLNGEHGSQVVASVSIGDAWRPDEGLQIQYGVRLDGNRFLARPPLNQAMESALGVRNDVVPNGVYVSPRIGMQWRYGQSQQIASALGGARPPQAVIHLGAGVFQNMASASLIAPALRATGLPGSMESILCVGSAVPVPNWNAFITDPNAIPATCADGTSGSLNASSSPSVTLFDQHFTQPRSIRVAGDWSGPVISNRFVLGVQGILSNGLSQYGMVDVNVLRAPKFVLPNEGGRPIYADPAAIVPTTGSIPAGSGRVSPTFQHVWVESSGLGARSAQLTVNLKPVTANPNWRWDLTYTLLDVHEQYYGFTSTGGDPFATEWSENPTTPRHAVMLKWNDFPIFDMLYVSLVVQAASGRSFTPRVGSDVNGDGSLNDRAFIPASDASALGTAMRTLLAGADPRTLDCLTSQVNTIATRGSCKTAWSLANALQVKFNPSKIGLPKRATVSLTVVNPLGIADIAFHGASDVRGWGQVIAPDENLLYVRGFDPTSRRFQYDVNQRFGSTRVSESAVHAVPYIGLGVSVDIGVARERQVLVQRLDMGRSREGTRSDEETLKSLGTSTIPNPMSMLLQQESALHLTRVQADSLANLSRRFSVFADSVWTPVASHLSSLPSEYDQGEAYQRYVSARERTIDILLELVPLARSVLSAEQLRQLPPQVANFLDARVLRFLRSSTSGSALGISP